MKNNRQKAYARGKRAENIAAWFLRFKGFHIAARRYKVKGGEIDLIARRGNLVAIVEVKMRPTLREAMEAVGRENERRIIAAADDWLSRQPDRGKLSLRFDLIALAPWARPVHVCAFFNTDE